MKEIRGDVTGRRGMGRIERIVPSEGIRLKLLELLHERIHLFLLPARQSRSFSRRLHGSSPCRLPFGEAFPSLAIRFAYRANPFLDVRVGDLQLRVSRCQA